MKSSEVKNICCIGAGYVGGPTMAVIADNCPSLKVNVVDINEERIKKWNEKDVDLLPIYEPGLAEIIKRCRNKNLFFSIDIKQNIESADMIFLSVNTPIKKSGLGKGQASDLKYIESSTREIAKYAKGETIIVEKSTLPVRTAETIKSILESNDKSSNNQKFSVLSNPEFLAEGTAINDLENPDRVLIGGENPEAITALEEIYLNWVDKNKILKTNLWSSELSKLVANAFLAQRISSINSISAICETTGADINEVSRAIGMDTRIGEKFLNAGPGYGGSCFKKDILNLVYLSEYYGLSEVASYWQKVVDLNNWQQHRIRKIIVKKLFNNLTDKKIGIMGFSFKANTNDTRESPAIQICKDLIEEGADLRIFDPKVNKYQIEKDLEQKQFNNYGEGSWTFCKSIKEIAIDADAIVIATEWEEFKSLDWSDISRLMRSPKWLFDTRGITNSKDINKHNINYWKIGLGDNPLI
tara:strand:- start:2952 stop:4361 length:1410 start_codon:yes stop_codon:yes gene_type:complete